MIDNAFPRFPLQRARGSLIFLCFYIIRYCDIIKERKENEKDFIPGSAVRLLRRMTYLPLNHLTLHLMVWTPIVKSAKTLRIYIALHQGMNL